MDMKILPAYRINQLKVSRMRATFYLMPVLLAASAVTSAAYQPENVPWSRLEFQTKKFLLTASSEVELSGRPSLEAITELLDPVSLTAGQGRRGDEVLGLEPRGDESYRIDIRTRILSRKSRIRFWFDPGDARALQRSSHDVSKKRLRHRTYRYTRGGVFSHTRTPLAGEADRPYTDWNRVDDLYVAFPSGMIEPVAATNHGYTRRVGAVTEPAGLLYLVPAGNFHAVGDKDQIHVFSRGKVREVDVVVIGKERLDVDYLERSESGERQIRGRVETLRIGVRPRVGAGQERSDFKLLGLEGDIDIFIDPKTRVPLLVTGKIPVVGGVRLRLRRAVMR